MALRPPLLGPGARHSPGPDVSHPDPGFRHGSRMLAASSYDDPAAERHETLRHGSASISLSLSCSILRWSSPGVRRERLAAPAGAAMRAPWPITESDRFLDNALRTGRASVDGLRCQDQSLALVVDFTQLAHLR
jgi:hypothetical protein